MDMIEANKKYPNKEDYEPRGTRNKAGVILTDELPLSDPADSNTSDAFRKNQQTSTGKHEPSAFNENKRDTDTNEEPKAMRQSDQNEQQQQGSYSFNKDVHNKWNDQNPKDNPVRE